MSTVTEEAARLICTFKKNPLASQPPDVRRFLNRFRAAPAAGKYVLLCLEPHRRWQLARLTGRRGGAVQPIDNAVFSDLAEAEWQVFSRRWIDTYGEEPRC